MTDPVRDPVKTAENFLQRWSRLKQTAETHARQEKEPPGSASAEAGPSTDPGAQGKSHLPVFDPATLPPIDSITATSDIRAFLAPGVPEELSRAALRRAWMTDPAIRDFVGLAENQWDFTKPDSVPGFGSLELTPELRRMAARLVGELTEQPPPGAEPVKQIGHTVSESPATAPHDAVQARSKPQTPPPDDIDAATQTECQEADAARSPHRRHGGAMPK